MVEVTGLREDADVVNRLTAMITAKLDPWQYRQFAFTQLLKLGDAKHIDGVVVRYGDRPQTSLNERVDDLLVGKALILVVERRRRVDVKIPSMPERASRAIGRI